MKHPAKYNDKLISIFYELLEGSKVILDPMAGTGKIFKLLEEFDSTLTIHAIEIEPEWAMLDKRITMGDALNLPYGDNTFDAIIVSPTYGNRMADKFLDNGWKYNTYANALGRNVNKNSSAKLQWGDEYREFHRRAWAECLRVLRSRGKFILNIKDHIRKGEVMQVSAWHRNYFLDSGLTLDKEIKVSLSGNRFGENREKRIDYENVYRFIKL